MGKLETGVEPVCQDGVKKGSWVICQYVTKKSTKFYAGEVIDIDKEELVVKFLRPSRTSGMFTWPEKENTEKQMGGKGQL
jgi:hypothetical protein